MRTLVKIGIGVVALLVLAWLFVSTLRDTIAEPYDVDDSAFSGWTLVSRPPSPGAAAASGSRPFACSGPPAAHPWESRRRATCRAASAPSSAWPMVVGCTCQGRAACSPPLRLLVLEWPFVVLGRGWRRRESGWLALQRTLS